MRSDFLRRSSVGLGLMVSLAVCLIMLALPSDAGAAGENDDGVMNGERVRREIVIPLVDPERGRRLFVTKGCFICHSIGGVGGKAAPVLDATGEAASLDLMGFVARMWRGAPAMLELQLLELGYRIELDGAEIADLAAFAADPKAQRDFSSEDIPDPLRDWQLDEPYWLQEEWPEQFEQEFDQDTLPFDYD